MIWKLQRVGDGVCVGAWVVSERGGGARGGGGKKGRRRGVAMGRLLLPHLPALRFCPTSHVRSRVAILHLSLSFFVRVCWVGVAGGWRDAKKKAT